MKKRILYSLGIFLLFVVQLSAQDRLWTKLSSKESFIDIQKKSLAAYDIYHLDLEGLKNKLKGVSKRDGKISHSSTIYFPDVDGNLIGYYVNETSIMHPDLASRFPNNKSYVGVAINNSAKSIHFSINGLGLYAMVFSPGKTTVYIDPIKGESENYTFYKREDLKVTRSFECLAESQTAEVKAISHFKNASDLQLRTFELALASTGEYSQFHIDAAGVSNGTDAEKRAAVLDAMVVTMTRVNAIFERDVALTMQLIADTDQLIFLDGDTDPYSNGDGGAMLTENQTTIDNIIGAANYDIGHVFSTGGGGVAFLGSPCGSNKAGGVTGQTVPVGDPFDVDFVAHEMGHQFGANHTFNGTAGSCNGNRNNNTAVEPGSGTTIMAYAGICSPQNVQLNSDDYFHIVSIQEMFNFISGGATCDDETNFTTNANAPTANAGNNFTVPRSTPLVLKGQGSDLDGDTLTYTWEQIDNETNGISIPPASTQTGGAVFRSLLPATSPNRYLPSLSTVVSGDLSSTWEVLPSVGRTMDFTFTVRDNVIGEGQTASDNVTITVDGNSAPFQVTSQDAETIYWAVGASETIVWDVANTNIAPVNSPNVNILLSLDGGFTYPITLASNTPNDGNHDITVPNNITSTARVKIEGVNHIFYALNKTNINIINDFALTTSLDEQTICIPDNAVFNFNASFTSGFSENVSFSTNNAPAGATISFNPTSTNSTTSVQMTVSGTENIAPNLYTFEIVGTATSVTRTLQVTLEVFDPEVEDTVLNNPNDGATGVLAIGTSFTWLADTNATNYDIEIATDALFNTIIESANVLTNSYIPQNLVDATTYYWRVRTNNPCASGDFSLIRAFTTSEIVCTQYNANDVPLNIPDNTPTGVSSNVNVADDYIVSDVNVSINVTHSWMSDLIFNLESPTGTIIELVNRKCSGPNNVNMAATFDDLGVDLVCANSSPVITGTIKPSDDLSGFNGESSLGDWTLTVSDNADLDTGSITSWSIELCESVAVASINNEEFQNLEMWPNPTDDVINISFLSTNLDTTHIRIYDVLGREVLHKTYQYEAVLFNEQFGISNLASGTYLVSISRGNVNATKRLLIF